jgi:hypothetical protein
MSDIPVTPQETVIRGRITNVTRRDGDFGPVIVVEVEEPNSPTVAQIFFPFSAKPNSKWLIFVNSLNALLPMPVTSVSEMVGRWVQIRKQIRTLEMRSGETRTIEQPLIEKLLTEEEAKSEQIDPEVLALIEENYATLSPEDFKSYVAELGYDLDQVMKLISAPF